MASFPRSGPRKAALVLALTALASTACSPGYLDVTSRARRDSAADAPGMDGGCQLDGGCATGAASWALAFDGIADCARALRPVSKSFTLEAWVVLEASGSGTTWWEGLPIFWADRDAQASDFSATVLNGLVRFVTGSPTGDVMVSGRLPLPRSRWVHLAVTRTMSTGAVSLFVNGDPDGSGTGTTVELTGEGELWVLCSNTGLSTPGLIDELRAWNVARSQAEIQATLHTRLTGSEPGLVGYWPFDEGVGSSASDASPTGNPLLLGGSGSQTAPTWVVSTAPIEGP